MRCTKSLRRCLDVPINIDDSAKASLVNFAPENVDVDWIISETDEYGN